MIKKSIFTFLLLSVMGCVTAQSLQFELNGTVFSEGESIVCNSQTEWGEFLQDMQIRNLTDQDLNVLVEKEVMDNLEGSTNFFCWGMCFSPDIIVSPRSVALAANSVSEEGALSFHATFEEAVFGKVQVKYYAYDERHPDEKVSIVVVFHKSGVGIDENEVRYAFGKAYPNPATSTVNFNYELSASANASVTVFNLVGQEVLSQDLNAVQGHVSISVADLNEGIYFCTLKVNDKAVSTEKFVVRR